MNTLSELARHFRRAYGFATARPSKCASVLSVDDHRRRGGRDVHTRGTVELGLPPEFFRRPPGCAPGCPAQAAAAARAKSSSPAPCVRSRGDREGFAELLLERAEELRAQIRSATGRRFAHVRAPLESLAGARPSVLPTEGAAARGSEFGSRTLHAAQRAFECLVAQEPPTPRSIQARYLVLLFGNTLAASLIWGINTIFLLDAGLSNLEAFAANAFFTAGMVLFEVPTGIVADTAGRRTSYLLGTVTLSVSTLLYVFLWQIAAPFWAWAVVSVLIGLGFTFFSGAVEAWLVDALTATGFTGSVESVFGRGQVVSGAAMLGGSVAGGFIAEQWSLAVPFVLRGLILV